MDAYGENGWTTPVPRPTVRRQARKALGMMRCIEDNGELSVDLQTLESRFKRCARIRLAYEMVLILILAFNAYWFIRIGYAASLGSWRYIVTILAPVALLFTLGVGLDSWLGNWRVAFDPTERSASYSRFFLGRRVSGRRAAIAFADVEKVERFIQFTPGAERHWYALVPKKGTLRGALRISPVATTNDDLAYFRDKALPKVEAMIAAEAKAVAGLRRDGVEWDSYRNASYWLVDGNVHYRPWLGTAILYCLVFPLSMVVAVVALFCSSPKFGAWAIGLASRRFGLAIDTEKRVVSIRGKLGLAKTRFPLDTFKGFLVQNSAMSPFSGPTTLCLRMGGQALPLLRAKAGREGPLRQVLEETAAVFGVDPWERLISHPVEIPLPPGGADDIFQALQQTMEQMMADKKGPEHA